MKDNTFTAWDFRKPRKSDARILKEFGDKPGAVGAGAADPSAIDFSGHLRNFEDTVKAIKAGKKPAVDGKEARKAIEIILAIYKSALAGGKEVTLPLKSTPKRKSFR